MRSSGEGRQCSRRCLRHHGSAKHNARQPGRPPHGCVGIGGQEVCGFSLHSLMLSDRVTGTPRTLWSTRASLPAWHQRLWLPNLAQSSPPVRLSSWMEQVTHNLTEPKTPQPAVSVAAKAVEEEPGMRNADCIVTAQSFVSMSRGSQAGVADQAHTGSPHA